MKFDVIGWFDGIYSNLPPLSSELKEFIVRILPFLTIVFGILITIASIMDFLGSTFITTFTLGGPSIFKQLLLRSVLGIAQGVIMIFAFLPLRKHQERGWILLFLSQILWILAAALSLDIAVVLGFLIFYPLFQVKPYYSK
ncbi:MAG: hypothetical protein HYW63_02360 [Candidatus Levybacteria bacterium]|nr:hypothetical protein [Candidatus Levybacteria bacterium]